MKPNRAAPVRDPRPEPDRDADREDGGVVVEPVAEPVQQRAHGRHGVRRGGRCLRGQELQQGLLLVPLGAVDAGLGQAVGVEQERVARAEAQGGADEGGLGQQADDLPAGHLLVAHGAVGAHQHRRGVPAGGQDDVAAVGRRREHAEHDAAEAVGRLDPLAVQRRVELGQHGDRVGVVDRRRAQRVAGQRGHDRRARAVAAHVADEQRPPAVVQPEQVVEVAADLVGGGGVVVGGGLQPGHHRQRGWQQGALQRGRQSGEAVTLAVGLPPRRQQLALVRAALAGVDDRRADQQRLAVAPGLERRGHEHRQPATVGGRQLQRHPVDLALHLQQRREVRLVVEPSAHGQQVREPPHADDLVALAAPASPAAWR